MDSRPARPSVLWHSEDSTILYYIDRKDVYTIGKRYITATSRFARMTALMVAEVQKAQHSRTETQMPPPPSEARATARRRLLINSGR
ncbi:hypothetical protein KIN20_006451 [Parelaphostrongylus tenuis]|uniref:Uncharacterized protein n=1 Tax=Parelaphostrongylus tenuis TaxID=148309 RepID=A0AAD5QL18_PARTN|nr:hypothetical protein KIN20_006451 [Parelaphostrongylus tenuis]